MILYFITLLIFLKSLFYLLDNRFTKKAIIICTLFFSSIGYTQNTIMVVVSSYPSASASNTSFYKSDIYKSPIPTITLDNVSYENGTTQLNMVHSGAPFVSYNGTNIESKKVYYYNVNTNEFPLTLYSIAKLKFSSNVVCYTSDYEYYDFSTYQNGYSVSINSCYVITQIFSPNMLRITASESTKGVCENISLTGYSKYYYSKNGTSNWTIIPIPNGSQTMNFIPKDIPDIGSNYRGNLYIKADFTVDQLHDGATLLPPQSLETKPVIYNIIPCPPTLNSTTLENYTTCNDKKDGEVTFTFNRPLESNERFLFTRNPVGANATTSSKPAEIEKISEYEYKWKNIAPGTYNFKYHTQFNNETPSSPIIGNDFIITPKAELKFTPTPIQPLCNTDNGSIILEVNGGTAPYYYILDYATENINGQDLPKKISISVPIQGLSEGNHNIKVVDTNGCMQTQE
jgi:hypothetical protein